ncbi:N-acetylmuramoyl-L-alanine amidase [Dysgonomonas sp. 520]|uniref:N-acetylmuramoyl-L-alanine amidase family protein n=1 Tax=Dysgonomonas sp. 520 TaxID=2302931 RepID=UPI0013D8355E|nr:N-acetylmuramoyl-L-alanine amidase [Dysgonomonas sp. 520]NDW08677.1 N-acetylmuramoyl-L-alanine amidase [Dysgonomonas sp. 520]
MRFKIFVCTLFFVFFCVTISAQNKKTDTPKNGEGVDMFLRRNGYTTKEDRRKFLDLNKKKLGKDNSLKLGVKYTLPASSTKTSKKDKKKKIPTGNQPLFGSKLAKYDIISDKLKGACYYLVCGHGGPDPGTTYKLKTPKGTVTLSEDEYAYDIMLRVARNLLMNGATVDIIIQDAKDGIREDMYLENSKRETCMGASISISQKERLKQRTDKINELSSKSKAKYQRAIFFHIDSWREHHRVDAYFIYHKDSSLGKSMAQNLRDELKVKYNKHQPTKRFNSAVKAAGVDTDKTLYVLGCKPVSVYAELGNLKNEKDRQRFLYPSNRQYLADWLTLGLIKDYQENK